MSRPVRLAIVGASARAAAQSALRAGFDVVTADLFADEDLRRLCPATRIPQEDYPEGLADWLAERDVDAWMYTGALENFPDVVDRMSEIRPLWGNRGKALRRVRDPMELQRVFQEHGLLFPETRSNVDGLPLDGSWLVKRRRSSGGAGVQPLEGYDQPPADGSVVFQERAEGITASLVYLGFDSHAELVGGSEQLAGEPTFHSRDNRYCGSVRHAGLLRNHANAVFRLGDVLSSTFKLRGVYGVDVIVSGDQLWVLEVNPRYPASAEVSEDIGLFHKPLLTRHAKAFNAESLQEARQANQCPAGKAIYYAPENTVTTRAFSQWALEEAGAYRLADIPAAGARIETGQPVLTILEGGPPEGVLDRLKARAAEVESRLYA